MKLFVLIFLALFTYCSTQERKIPPIIPSSEDMIPEPPIEETKIRLPQVPKSVEEKLRYYFYGREIKPWMIVNNLYDGARKEREEKIKVSNHTISWFHSFTETKIKNDNDFFTLKNKKTLNDVNDEKGDVDFANNWDQIKLFKFNDRELIGISMNNDPCTGIGCRVTMYLIYDLKTKGKNFFGTYRFLLDREFGLYDFKNDGTLDFLSGTYNDDNLNISGEIENIYEVFTINETGNFHLQSDAKGNKYFMKRVYKEDDYEEIDSKFEQNWVEEIK